MHTQPAHAQVVWRLVEERRGLRQGDQEGREQECPAARVARWPARAGDPPSRARGQGHLRQGLRGDG